MHISSKNLQYIKRLANTQNQKLLHAHPAVAKSSNRGVEGSAGQQAIEMIRTTLKHFISNAVN
jgi:hypothetical protein